MQGGDLIKWDKAKVGYYVGVDIAEGSVSILSHKTFILCVHLHKCTRSYYVLAFSFTIFLMLPYEFSV
jgi:hypothetical protein